MYVLKMHHVCTVGTWGGEASKGKLLTASLGSGQDVATSSQPEREREREREMKYALCVCERERSRNLLEI